jgi:hypothetical protein
MHFLRLIMLMLAIGIAPVAALAYGLISPSEDYLAESAIMSAGSAAAKVKQIKRVPSVGVLSLNVPYFRGGTSFSEYRVSASKNAAGINRLQSALYRNPVTRKALVERGIPINQIVGVRISSNGSLRVYVLY